MNRWTQLKIKRSNGIRVKPRLTKNVARRLKRPQLSVFIRFAFRSYYYQAYISCRQLNAYYYKINTAGLIKRNVRLARKISGMFRYFARTMLVYFSLPIIAFVDLDGSPFCFLNGRAEINRRRFVPSLKFFISRRARYFKYYRFFSNVTIGNINPTHYKLRYQKIKKHLMLRKFRFSRPDKGIRLNLRVLRIWWRLSKKRRRASRKKIKLKLRLLRAYWRQLFNLKRNRKLKRFFITNVSTRYGYKLQFILRKLFLRLDVFLVYAFKIKTLKRARILINNKHIFVNAKSTSQHDFQLKQFDVISFSRRCRGWLKTLWWRGGLKRKKRRLLRRARVFRKNQRMLLFGPLLKYVVLWNVRSMRIRPKRFSQIVGKLPIKAIKLLCTKARH